MFMKCLLDVYSDAKHLQYVIIPLEVSINTFWILGMLVPFWLIK